jgi:acetyl-CoA synthetase (ADP-forming)
MDGALVSVMVAGRRELVAGLVRDPQFGPCVMAGLGGVLTEAFADVGFRMAPVDRLEAMDLIDGLACRRMLDPVRGLAAADTDALADVLVALSRVGLDHDQVAEIDVNPLIVKPDGGVVAVDALVLLKGEDHA